MEYRIKEICKRKGILIKDLAKQIGITDVGLRQSIQGNPTIGTLERIADVLDVNVSDLLKESQTFMHLPSSTSSIICPNCGTPIALHPTIAEK